VREVYLLYCFFIPPLHRRGVNCFTSVLPSVCPSVRPKIFFGAFFSATIDGRNLIFGHKLHIGTVAEKNAPKNILGRTEGQTDGRTEVKQFTPLRWSGGIKKQYNK
jgi:hypothetical protein